MTALALLERYWRTFGALPGIQQFWATFSQEGAADMATTKKPSVTPKIVREINELTEKLEAAHQQAKIAEASINPCATWATVKPYWGLIVRLVGIIPRVGGKISAALVTIGTVLDSLCPTP